MVAETITEHIPTAPSPLRWAQLMQLWLIISFCLLASDCACQVPLSCPTQIYNIIQFSSSICRHFKIGFPFIYVAKYCQSFICCLCASLLSVPRLASSRPTCCLFVYIIFYSPSSAAKLKVGGGTNRRRCLVSPSWHFDCSFGIYLTALFSACQLLSPTAALKLFIVRASCPTPGACSIFNLLLPTYSAALRAMRIFKIFMSCRWHRWPRNSLKTSSDQALTKCA